VILLVSGVSPAIRVTGSRGANSAFAGSVPIRNRPLRLSCDLYHFQGMSILGQFGLQAPWAGVSGVKFECKRKLPAQQIDHAQKLIDTGGRCEDRSRALLNVNCTTLYWALV